MATTQSVEPEQRASPTVPMKAQRQMGRSSPESACTRTHRALEGAARETRFLDCMETAMASILAKVPCTCQDKLSNVD